MHDIWNPWHGCRKCSEGCENCYMYFLDRMRDQDGSRIYRTKNGFRYPLSKDRQGKYKVKSGEMIRVCMTSDFFLEEADERIPILFELPFKHKGIMTAPLIGPVDIEKYLAAGQIEQVICGGENYDGSRLCRYEWVKLLMVSLIMSLHCSKELTKPRSMRLPVRLSVEIVTDFAALGATKVPLPVTA